MRTELGPVGQRVAAVAAGAHGILTGFELRDLGLHPSRIKRWVKAGRLHLIHRGVYSVGTPSLTREARWLAAVKACGPRALLSHLSAAVLWGMLKIDPLVIDVTAPRGRKPRDGIRLHRPVRLEPQDRAEHNQIPVTSPERTWFDLASMLGEQRLRRALSEAERDDLLDPAALIAQLRDRRGVSGAGAARRILTSYRPAPAGVRFRSSLERTFWEACLDAGLEEPEVNAIVCGIEVDMLWRERMLVVELDGSRYHRTREDRRRDAERTALLRAAAFTVLRFSDQQVERELRGVLRSVAGRLRPWRQPRGFRRRERISQ